MSTRSFAVFIDSPQTSQSTATASPGSDNSSSRSPSVTPATSLASLAPTADKENVDPVTGQFSGPNSSNVAGKKRKTGVLVTKTHLTSGSKPKESKPESKKRKSSAPSSKGKAAASKKVLKDSSRKGGKGSRSPRRSSPLPQVDEVEEVERDKASQKEGERLLQTDIDSRCYDLTVSPLADVTTAYGSPLLDHDLKFNSAKEKSAEPELRDYFSPSLLSSVSLPIMSKPSGTPPPDSKTLSTPERKQIYAAFTFTSPSPTSERFSKTRPTREPPIFKTT